MNRFNKILLFTTQHIHNQMVIPARLGGAFGEAWAQAGIRQKDFWIPILSVVFLLSVFPLPAAEAPQSGKVQAASQLRVVTSFYPVYISTINIVKNVPGVQVVNLTKPFAGCLHDYQLAPADLKTLAKADVFIVNGLGMESFLDKATGEIPGLKISNASAGIEPITSAGGTNPHVWLSITLAIKQARNIAAGLAARDPVHAFLYMQNCDDYVRKLETLRARMQAGLKSLKTREFVTFHEAFPYFAREFNLNIVAVVEREPGSEPSAREMAETIELIKKNNARAIFIEPQYPDKSALAIARETGIAACVLDPAVTGPMQENAYLQIMESNLATLVKTLKN